MALSKKTKTIGRLIFFNFLLYSLFILFVWLFLQKYNFSNANNISIRLLSVSALYAFSYIYLFSIKDEFDKVNSKFVPWLCKLLILSLIALTYLSIHLTAIGVIENFPIWIKIFLVGLYSVSLYIVNISVLVALLLIALISIPAIKSKMFHIFALIVALIFCVSIIGYFANSGLPGNIVLPKSSCEVDKSEKVCIDLNFETLVYDSYEGISPFDFPNHVKQGDTLTLKNLKVINHQSTNANPVSIEININWAESTSGTIGYRFNIPELKPGRSYEVNYTGSNNFIEIYDHSESNTTYNATGLSWEGQWNIYIGNPYTFKNSTLFINGRMHSSPIYVFYVNRQLDIENLSESKKNLRLAIITMLLAVIALIAEIISKEGLFSWLLDKD